VLDSGSIPCSGSPVDVTAPNTPTNLTATTTGSTHVDLSWTSATDNVGVTNYEIYRDGALIDTIGSTTSYADNTVVGSISYKYKIRAQDAVGNFSGFTSEVPVTAPFLFWDDFESGDLTTKWTSVTGLTVQSQEVYDGAYAARQTSTGAQTSAYKTLASGQSDIYARLRFKIISLSSITYLLKFRTSGGTALLSVYVSSANKLGYRNETGGGANTDSTTTVTNGVWHDLQAHVTINGTSSQVEIWLDGVLVGDLSDTLSLGTTTIRRVQLGDNTGGTYDVAFDNVLVNNILIDMTPPTVTLSEPSDSAIVREDVTLTADASDNSTIDRVEFFADGNLIGTDPGLGLWLEAADDQPADLLLEVGVSVRVAQDGHVGVHSGDGIGHDVEVLGRVQRHVDPRHRPDLLGPLPRTVDDEFGVDVPGIGAHPRHPAVARRHPNYPGALDDSGPTQPGALGEGERQIGRIGPPVGGQPDGPDEVVDPHHRIVFQRLFGGE